MSNNEYTIYYKNLIMTFRCGSLYLYLLGAVTTWSLLSHNIVHCREIIKVLEMPSTAKWNGVVLAESDNIVMVEGNKYVSFNALALDIQNISTFL